MCVCVCVCVCVYIHTLPRTHPEKHNFMYFQGGSIMNEC